MSTRPTLAVILPALNEEQRLPTQLKAILSQSRPCNKLVLRDDGSTDGTSEIMAEAEKHHRNVFRQHALVASGINNAFNSASQLAGTDWFYLASANDELLPGAFEAWEKGAIAFPDARIAAGSPYGHYLGWLPKTGFMTPTMAAQCMKRDFIHGCGTFIRRDAWEQYGGYNPELGSLADFWLYNMVTCRDGMIYLSESVAKSSWRHTPSGHMDVKDKEKRREIVAKVEAMLAGEFADVRPFFETTVLAKVLKS